MRREDRYAWVFVVDTDQYSGNFEREMGAYLTGKVRKYFSEISRILAQLYKQETGDLAAIQFVGILGKHEPDLEHGSTYVSTWGTPGWFNHGMGGFFRDGQEKEALEDHRKICLKEARAARDTDTKKEWRNRAADERLYKCPAGMSVAIAFTERPNVEQLAILEERAMNFPDALKRAEKIKSAMVRNDKDVPDFVRRRRKYITGPIPTITGTRLLQRVERYEEV